MFEWGNFILAPRRGSGGGRGSRNNGGPGRDERPFDPTYTGRETEEEVGGGSYGRGRGQDWRESANWKYNSVYNRQAPHETGEGMTGKIHVPVGETVMRENDDTLGLDVTSTRMIVAMESNVLGKRYAADSGLAALGNVDDIPHVAGGVMVPAGNTATKVDIFVGGENGSSTPIGTPQKNANKKKLKASKHMKVKTQCTECKKGPDSIRHFLFECPRSSAVWKQLGMFDIVKRVCTKYKSGEDAIYELLHMETSGIILLGCLKLREVVATAAWYLWFEHRKVYHGDDIQTAPQIALAIRGLSANFSIACAKTAKGRTGGWSKPPHGYVKPNVDAGFDHDLLRGSIGAIIRDQKGQFLAAANDKIDICYDSNTAEALAVRLGLNLARTIGCSKIVVNSNNLEIVEDLKKGYSSSTASAIIDDCFFLGSEFKHVLYDHCGRDSNQVAHELAKLAKSSPLAVGWTQFLLRSSQLL
ncbi:hypothetical protein D1007_44087 [Hordeum vulgare]|nr:hypothetical protein D1007_44087 [Hordeum vulgare]